jgi:hypothetical protein
MQSAIVRPPPPGSAARVPPVDTLFCIVGLGAGREGTLTPCDESSEGGLGTVTVGAGGALSLSSMTVEVVLAPEPVDGGEE